MAANMRLMTKVSLSVLACLRCEGPSSHTQPAQILGEGCQPTRYGEVDTTNPVVRSHCKSRAVLPRRIVEASAACRIVCNRPPPDSDRHAAALPISYAMGDPAHGRKTSCKYFFTTAAPQDDNAVSAVCVGLPRQRFLRNLAVI